MSKFGQRSCFGGTDSYIIYSVFFTILSFCEHVLGTLWKMSTNVVENVGSKNCILATNCGISHILHQRWQRCAQCTYRREENGNYNYKDKDTNTNSKKKGKYKRQIIHPPEGVRVERCLWNIFSLNMYWTSILLAIRTLQRTKKF